MEQWLKARRYRDGLVREQILPARKFKRDDLLDRKPREATGNKLIFNITYHPAFARIKDTLSKIHLLLTPNEEQRNVFPTVHIIGLRRGKRNTMRVFQKNYLLKKYKHILQRAYTRVCLCVSCVIRKWPCRIRVCLCVSGLAREWAYSLVGLGANGFFNRLIMLIMQAVIEMEIIE